MVAWSFSFITGVMLGFEFADHEESNFLIINLLIVQIMIEWEK